MIASLLRTFGFVPGGLGTFEAASVSALALTGMPVPVGLSATLMFRGLSFWLPMVPGLAFSRRLTETSTGATSGAGPLEYWASRRRTLLPRCTRASAACRARMQNADLQNPARTKSGEREGFTRLGVLWNQLRSPLLLLLLFAAAVSIVTGEWADAVIVLAIVVASVGIGYTREYRAQTAAEELRARVRVQTVALRDGEARSVPIAEIVPGDVVLVSAGQHRSRRRAPPRGRRLLRQRVGADGRKLPGAQAPGTGAAGRSARPALQLSSISVPTCAAAPRVASSSHTGRATEFGAIAHRLTLRPPETEFDRGIRHFGYLLTSAMTVMVLLVLTVNLLLGRPLVETLLFSIALAVGLSPELLPAILSINLARGASAMAAHGVLVRRLNAIENLGSMDVLCTDKTGTLTEGIVKMHGAWDCDGATSPRVLELAAINAALQSGLVNPLDEAILLEHTPANGSRREGRRSSLRLRPQAPQRRGSRMRRALRLITKGAFEQVLAACTSSGRRRHAGRAGPQRAAPAGRDLDPQGIRVLAVATRTLQDTDTVRIATTNATSFTRDC